MSEQNAEEAVLKILVVDDHAFQRRVLSETLRALKRVEIEHVESIEQGLVSFRYFEPDVLIADWDVGSELGLDLVRRLRAGEAGERFKATPVIIVAEAARPSDLERARASGADEFVLRPFSTATLLKRIEEVRKRRREFVESTAYVGPCRRRRRMSGEYVGPRRRLFDTADKNADAPDIQMRKGIARMYVERIHVLVAAASPAKPDSMRDLCLTCGQLNMLSTDMRDGLLQSATSSLFNYVKGVGANSELNADVVKAHLDVVLQLAELPNSQIEIRQTVTQQLGVMVLKKLRQAGQAA